MPWPVHPTGFFGARGDQDTYRIERSLRFNSADSAYLSRTPASAGNRKTWTWSGWVKRGKLGTTQSLFARYTANTGSGLLTFIFWNDDTLRLVSGTTDYRITTAKYRDVSSWYHLVCSVDTTQATANNRVKFYVNGTEVTSFSTTNNFNQNDDTQVNENVDHFVGYYLASVEFDGYLTEINFIDGQALTPSSFGETDAITGRWKAKAYGGTYGTNGFYLKFADNSGTTSTTLGKDSSGNGNNWTPNNFSVTAGAGNDSLVDSPTNYGTDTGVGGEVRGNYCIWNRLNSNASSITNGNLDFIGDTGGAYALGVIGSVSNTSGKWYFECTSLVLGTSFVGVIPSTYSGTSSSDLEYVDGAYSYRNNGQKAEGTGDVTGDVFTSYGNSWTAGDVIGVALDLDNGAIYFSKNGTWQNSGVPTSGALKTGAAFTSFNGGYAPMACGFSSSSMSANFGQRPFAYTAPTGFKALCTTNLPTPSIQKPSTAMDVVTYMGDGTARSITGLGFSPDLVWIKRRSSSASHRLADTVRGAGNELFSNETSAELTNDAGGYVSAFNSDGFTFGTGAGVNNSGSTYVAWAWDAGSSNVTNTAGSITSTVRADATKGFSIVSYTGDGSSGSTVGHGLNVAPVMIILKPRSGSYGTEGWQVWHKLLSANNVLQLNSTSAQSGTANFLNGIINSSPTSSIFGFTAGSSGILNVNALSTTYIAYCFSEIEGYSKFGSYTGNGSADGPFVWCGFRPRWVMVKRTDTSGYNWDVRDTARDTYNTTINILGPNQNYKESDFGVIYYLDIMSSGFKIRHSDGSENASGGTYIFAAFAETPFKYARAR